MLSVSIGTVIWTTIAFLVVVFILSKFAWKPILNSIREREESIEEALEAAEKAKEKMKDLEASNEKLLQEARQEREEMMKAAYGSSSPGSEKDKDSTDRRGAYIAGSNMPSGSGGNSSPFFLLRVH